MKQKIKYKDSNGNEWVVEKKHIPMQEWNFYWIAECYELNLIFRGKTKNYVIKKIKEYEAN
jgi:hypothetical protein